MGDLTIYFSRKEFACPCCGKNDINLGLVAKLATARKHADIPFKISSGARCEKYNDTLVEKGLASKWSSHLKGLAADIVANKSETKYKIINSLFQAGFRRIGIGSNFVHCDIDEDKPQNVVWTYPEVKGVKQV